MNGSTHSNRVSSSFKEDFSAATRESDDVEVQTRRSVDTQKTNVLPRLVRRNLGRKNHQSRNTLSIETIDKKKSGHKTLYRNDWFHVILKLPVSHSTLLLLALWTFCILIFAVAYSLIDAASPAIECGLGSVGNPIEFGSAFAFSLETCTTVGYGLPGGSNAYFELACPGLQFTIYLQMVWSMMFNAFLFAFFFTRLARCDQRGMQVIFSDKAIIHLDPKDKSKWLFKTRVYDLASMQPLVEAHVRLYTVSYRDNNVQLQTLRVLDPNDELGAVLYPSVPSTVTHHIDAYSPLSPSFTNSKDANILASDHGLVLREVDSYTYNRDCFSCPVCGETYSTLENLYKHIKYSTTLEDVTEGLDVKGSHRDQTLIGPIVRAVQVKKNGLDIYTQDDIRECLKDKEIICVFEAIEPYFSGTFEAIQSYKAEDIVFGGTYANCMTIDHNKSGEGKIVVDIDKFHEIIPCSYKTTLKP